MNKEAVIFAFVLFVMVSFSQVNQLVYSELPDLSQLESVLGSNLLDTDILDMVDLPNTDKFVSNEITLFVPEKMIVGETYRGMVTMTAPSFQDSAVLIEVDNDFIITTDSLVIVSANQNHGIFNITPVNAGTVEIFVSYNGEITSAKSSVFSAKSGPQQLKIILPGSSTIANDIKGFVFLLDGNGSPTISDKDRIVSLIASEKISVPQHVTIINGTTNAVFSMTVRATGDITATTSDLFSDTAPIKKSQEIIDVKLAVAPNIALEESYINYFVWLEKNGKPYTVPHVLKVVIQSSNTDVLRLGISPSSYKNVNTVTVSMMDGVAVGKLYTGERGSAEIFASIPEYGHATSLVSVGPAVLVDGNIIEEKAEFRSQIAEPNHIQLWVYPDVTNDVSYGVAALYYSDSEETLDVSLDEDGTQVTKQVTHTTLIPMKIDDSMISISSEFGLKHNSDYLLGSSSANLPTHSKIFEILAENVGDYTITATGGKSFDTANLQVTTTQNSQYSVLVTPLPIHSDATQPLMMVSIVDENGNIIDISNSFGSSLMLNAHTIDAVIGSSKIILGDNVGVVSGLLNGVGSITISSDQFGSTVQQLTPSGVPVSIEFLTPDSVHAGEPFPITIHEVDAGGIPISKQKTQIVSSSGFDKIKEGLISIPLEGQRQISVLASLGGAFQKHITSFTNQIIFDASLDAEQARVGQPVTIKIQSPISGVDYTIDSPFPYEKTSEYEFVITPDSEISDSKITITGQLKGFNNMKKQLLLSSENIVEIKVNAITSDGKVLSPNYDFHSGDAVVSSTTPHIHSIKPQQTVLKFHESWSTVAGGYRLVELRLDGETVDGNILDFYADTDKTITAIYDRFVQITVSNGQGSGIHPYGKSVVISAPDKAKISFLVTEKFDYWIGTDEKSSRFVITAEKDMEITAMYKDDYTVLMIVILVGTASFVAILVKKGDSAYGYHIGEMIEKITTPIKPLIKPLVSLLHKK